MKHQKFYIRYTYTLVGIFLASLTGIYSFYGGNLGALVLLIIVLLVLGVIADDLSNKNELAFFEGMKNAEQILRESKDPIPYIETLDKRGFEKSSAYGWNVVWRENENQERIAAQTTGKTSHG